MANRNIKSIDHYKMVGSGQELVRTVTTSVTGASGSVRVQERTIRISITTATVNDAISFTLPFAIEVVDVMAVCKSNVTDAQFSLRNAGNQLTSLRTETLDAIDRANSIDETYKAMAAGAIMKVTALSTGGSAVITVTYVPG